MLKVEIANTPFLLEQGLMFRKHLSSNEGMLFQFGSPSLAPFWGKNTYIPLEIAFVDSKHNIIEIKKITPMSTKPVYCSGVYNIAIEANDNFFSGNGISKGCKIKISKLDDKFSCVDFEKC